MEGKRISAGLSGIFTAASLVVPQSALALSLVEVAELFNIFVGFMLTASLLVFFVGLWVYFTRLGTWPSNRDQGIKIMEWGVALLFVLVVILAVVQFFQKYPKAATAIVASVALLLFIGLVFYVAVNTGAKKKEE